MVGIQVGHSSSHQIERGGSIIENAGCYKVDGLGYSRTICFKQLSFLPFSSYRFFPLGPQRSKVDTSVLPQLLEIQ